MNDVRNCNFQSSIYRTFTAPNLAATNNSGQYQVAAEQLISQPVVPSQPPVMNFPSKFEKIKSAAKQKENEKEKKKIEKKTAQIKHKAKPSQVKLF